MGTICTTSIIFFHFVLQDLTATTKNGRSNECSVVCTVDSITLCLCLPTGAKESHHGLELQGIQQAKFCTAQELSTFLVVFFSGS